MPGTRTRKTPSITVPAKGARAQGEAQLQLFKAALNLSKDAVLLVDGETGRITFANEAAARNLGYPRDLLTKMSAADVEAISPGNYEWTEHVGRVRKAGTLTLQTRHMRQDGSTFPVEVRLEWLPHEGGHILATARDISDQRRTESDLREAQDVLGILRTLPDVVFRCEKGRDGRIYWVFNEGRLAEEFHLTTQAVRGKPLESLFPPEVAQKLLPEFEACFRGETREFVNELGGRFFKHHPQPVLGPNGKVVAVVGFITEVTKLKEAEEENRRLNQQLAAKLAELEAVNKELVSYSYSVSHDLRTPLAVIDTLSQAIRIKWAPALGAEGQQALERLRNAVARMNQIISDLLVLSRVERVQIKQVRVDVAAIATAICAELQRQSPSRTVEVAIAPSLATQGDEGLLRTLLENLLSNAWKFTSKTGKARIEVGSTQAEGKTTFFVKDNGVGFDAAEASRLFQPFVRLHPTQDFEGSGIGLAIVGRIVKRHGGRIWAEARPNEGATFFFAL